MSVFKCRNSKISFFGLFSFVQTQNLSKTHVKITKNGDIQWEKTFGGSGLDYGFNGVLMPDGGVTITGITTSNDGDVSGFHGLKDIWTFRLKSDGGLVWQKAIGGSDGDASYGIALTPEGGLILVGNTWSTDGDAAGAMYHGGCDAWVIKLAPETLNANAPQQTQTLNISPNPAQDAISIQLSDSEQIIKTSIFNSSGALCLETTAPGDKILVASFPKGMYFVAIATQSGRIYTGKFVK